MVRKIIQIDEDKCNGCGLCIPKCAEGALKIVDGKAKVVKDSYCDGLGACLGHCPQGALEVVEREAVDFDMEETMKHIQAQKQAGRTSPSEHHGAGGCPGSRMRIMNSRGSGGSAAAADGGDIEIKIRPQLGQWPVQLSLIPVSAPFFQNADLLVTADCVPFAYPNYHLELLKGKAVVVGCPKLDDLEAYTEKLTLILQKNDIKSITVAFMEVPCCMGIVMAVEHAAAYSGKNVTINKVRIGIDGGIQKL